MTEHITSIVDPLIPVRSAFAMAGIGASKGYEEIRSGRLKPVRNGSRSFIRASEVRRYIDALQAASKEAA